MRFQQSDDDESVESATMNLTKLPALDVEKGIQKCTLGKNDFVQMKCSIASFVKLCISGKINVCSVWHKDKFDGYIMYDETVSLEPGSLNGRVNSHCNSKQVLPVIHECFITKLRTMPCGYLSISVVIMKHNRRLAKLHQTSPAISENMCKNCLIDICVLSGSTVDLSNNKLAQIYGIHAVIVHETDNEVNSTDAFIVSNDTKINITKVITVEKHRQSLKFNKLCLEIGGMEREIRDIMEIMEYRKNMSTNDFNLTEFCSPQGILLHGAPGCGKTSLVRYISIKSDAYLISINGSEILGSRPGESESNLEKRFDEAIQISEDDLCIIFIDEVDSICAKRGKDTSNNEARLTTQLLILMDKIKDYPNIKIIAATNRPYALDPALRRPGRFDREVIIGIPTYNQRLRILECITKNLPLSDNVVIEKLADMTIGYVGADLKCLCNEAAYSCLSQNRNQMQPIQHQGEITMSHFKMALSTITPSTQRGCDALVDSRPISWSDIGGLDDVKHKVTQAIEWPIKHPQSFTRLGIPRPKGVLLYGPPGCCKTTVVRAAAWSSGATFFSLSSAQLYSPYVGEAERTLTETFQRARMSSPSILFLDEIDSVVGRRSGEGATKGVQERVLSTLLNEMDGIGLRVESKVRGVREAEGDVGRHSDEAHMSEPVDNNGVMVVAATNRPDMVDDAVLRPGRFDRIIYVPPPDSKARQQILAIHTKHMPLSDDVNLADLANKCDLYTGADLQNLCKEAALYALTKDGLTTDRVNNEHFTHVLSTYQPSLTEQSLNQYDSLFKH